MFYVEPGQNTFGGGGGIGGGSLVKGGAVSDCVEERRECEAASRAWEVFGT